MWHFWIYWILFLVPHNENINQVKQVLTIQSDMDIAESKMDVDSSQNTQEPVKKYDLM